MKHVFNIILKLNIHTRKNLRKKISPKSVVLQSRKKLQVFEKKRFFKKKVLQLIYADTIFKMMCKVFFQINDFRNDSVSMKNRRCLRLYHCQMHLYRLRILLIIPLDFNIIHCLFQRHYLFSSGIHFSLVLWQAFCFFMLSKRT